MGRLLADGFKLKPSHLPCSSLEEPSEIKEGQSLNIGESGAGKVINPNSTNDLQATHEMQERRKQGVHPHLRKSPRG